MPGSTSGADELLTRKRYARSPRTASRAVDGREVVVAVDENRLYTLNGTASWVWQQLAEPLSLDEITQALCVAYQVDEATARGDCQRFCEELLRRGLLVSSP